MENITRCSILLRKSKTAASLFYKNGKTALVNVSSSIWVILARTGTNWRQRWDVMSYGSALTLCGMSVVLGNSLHKFKNLNILDSIHNPMERRLWACSIGQLEQHCYTHVTCPTLNNHPSNTASVFTAKTKKLKKITFRVPSTRASQLSLWSVSATAAFPSSPTTTPTSIFTGGGFKMFYLSFPNISI